ncbi:hypothetical protein ABZ749_31010, partial [Micromonospora sp. NPDC047753]|uniref:hypothetical protein n=1 Tax=Micromonospora sp. NPDC047753 TaxID=3154817 RepID=UPI0033FFD547
WRSATIAVAAAVVGGGLSTVLISAVTGQPIGALAPTALAPTALAPTAHAPVTAAAREASPTRTRLKVAAAVRVPRPSNC